MKKIKQTLIASLVLTSVLFGSCGPNSDKGSQDQDASGNEGDLDSSRMIPRDSTSAYIVKPAIKNQKI